MVLAVDRSAIAPIGEKRITLRNLDWQAYQQLRKVLENRSRVRFTYDCGTLELTMPLEEHEVVEVDITHTDKKMCFMQSLASLNFGDLMVKYGAFINFKGKVMLNAIAAPPSPSSKKQTSTAF